MANFEGTHRLEVVKGSGSPDSPCASFVLHKEGHTLGNSLRYMIMKCPDTSFCGYSIPHPSENKINLRIQTTGASSLDVLKDSLTNLSEVCEHVLDTFEASIVDYKSRHDQTDRAFENEEDDNNS